jgi:hypothetical protein
VGEASAGEGDSDSDKEDCTEEIEFFTDEQLNEVIARDDAEYELFQALD